MVLWQKLREDALCAGRVGGSSRDLVCMRIPQWVILSIFFFLRTGKIGYKKATSIWCNSGKVIEVSN